jgi:hypothetical protein
MNIFDDKWHHVVGTYTGSGGELAIYVDGILQDSQSATGPIDTSLYAVLIGANDQMSNREWGGLIDEVKIYNRGLSAAVILDDFIADGGSNSCNGVYDPADINQDCYVTLADLALWAGAYLDCSDVTDPACGN